MKKYLTIVLSLALALPFVSCKFFSDYMLDGELATANVMLATDWQGEQSNALNQAAGTQEAASAYNAAEQNEEQSNALNQAAGVQEAAVAYEAPKILDMSVSRIADQKMQVNLTLTNDAFDGFDVLCVHLDGSYTSTKLSIARTSDEVEIDQRDGKCFVTIKPAKAIRDGIVYAIIVDEKNGAGDCKDAMLQSN